MADKYAVTAAGLGQALGAVAGSVRSAARGEAGGRAQASARADAEARGEAEARAGARMRVRAPAALAALTRHGARRLLRRPLPAIAARVGALDPGGPPPARAVLAHAERAYATERARGRAGHWSYDLNRQLALAEAVVALRHLVRTGR